MSKKIDYLTTDPEIPGQNWACLSFLTPELVKMEKDCNVRSVKVRGVYSSEEEAKDRCETLQKIDGDHNVYIAPVGKWLPWCDDPEKATDFEYAESELNKLMKAYQKNQENAKIMHEERKNEMMKKNNEETEALKLNNKESSINLENSVNLDDVTDELEKAELLYKQMLNNQMVNNEENI